MAWPVGKRVDAFIEAFGSKVVPALKRDSAGRGSFLY